MGRYWPACPSLSRTDPGPLAQPALHHRLVAAHACGALRVWASIGWGSLSTVAGALISHTSVRYGLLVYVAMSVPALAVALLLKPGPRAKTAVGAAGATLARAEAAAPAGDGHEGAARGLAREAPASAAATDKEAGGLPHNPQWQLRPSRLSLPVSSRACHDERDGGGSEGCTSAGPSTGSCLRTRLLGAAVRSPSPAPPPSPCFSDGAASPYAPPPAGKSPLRGTAAGRTGGLPSPLFASLRSGEHWQGPADEDDSSCSTPRSTAALLEFVDGAPATSPSSGRLGDGAALSPRSPAPPALAFAGVEVAACPSTAFAAAAAGAPLPPTGVAPTETSTSPQAAAASCAGGDCEGGAATNTARESLASAGPLLAQAAAADAFPAACCDATAVANSAVGGAGRTQEAARQGSSEPHAGGLCEEGEHAGALVVVSLCGESRKALLGVGPDGIKADSSSADSGAAGDGCGAPGMQHAVTAAGGVGGQLKGPASGKGGAVAAPKEDDGGGIVGLLLQPRVATFLLRALVIGLGLGVQVGADDGWACPPAGCQPACLPACL
jgi:hypothetical protein